MDNEKKTKSTALTELIDWIETILFSFLTVILIFTFVLRTSEVIGPSMNPTFTGRDDDIGQTGDKLVYVSFMDKYDNGDVVVVNSAALDEVIIKRVIAKPGQTIDIDFESGAVTVDGTMLNENYIADYTYLDLGKLSYPITLGEDEYFIMGDNRNHSVDSRAFGPININEIYGKVAFRYSPFSKFGVVKDE